MNEYLDTLNSYLQQRNGSEFSRFISFKSPVIEQIQSMGKGKKNDLYRLCLNTIRHGEDMAFVVQKVLLAKIEYYQQNFVLAYDHEIAAVL